MRTPARATLSPISIQMRIAVSQEKVIVPGEAMCSLDLPTGWIGRKVTGRPSGSNSTVRLTMPSPMQASV